MIELLPTFGDNFRIDGYFRKMTTDLKRGALNHPRNIPPSSSGNRPGTQRRQLGSAAGRPPGTATRLTTAMNPGTARPGTRGGQGGGVALNTQVNVVDRPMTQQGLGGMKTAAKGQRQVQDKSYFLGLVRAKITELNTEVAKLAKEVETANEENSSYLTYEKRAEKLAAEIRDYQGELGDYNTLVDKLNTDEDIQDVEFDYSELKSQNDKETQKIEELFDMKQSKDVQIKQLETELDQEKRMADNLVNDMKPEMKQKYFKFKDTNEHLLKQLESGQQELDALNTKLDNLQEELSMSQVKQEAVRLYEHMHEFEVKRDSLVEEAQSRGDPAQEREKLLKQVKEDNQEIASMDRQANELREKTSQVHEDIRQLDMDIEENQGERNQKYKELKKREESMEEFLKNFEESKAQELEKKEHLEQNIVALLDHVSRNMSRFSVLPTPLELAQMKEDLSFKSGEMKKSETTASGLAIENDKLTQDLQKVEQLESKISTELAQLKEKIDQMKKELLTFSDLNSLKDNAEQKRKKLMEDKVVLQKRRETFKKMMTYLTSKYEGLKAQLNENETFAQLGNLERKWQHHEQNNFVMKEFISTKTMECDYRPISQHVQSMVSDYHSLLQDQVSGKHS